MSQARVVVFVGWLAALAACGDSGAGAAVSGAGGGTAAAGAAGACTSDGDCRAGLFCDPSSERCVECWKNAHCPGELCQLDHTCG